MPSLDPQSRRLQRLLIGHATDTGIDGQGRILIPPPLREFAGLGHKVVLIGQGSKFELWDEEVWNAHRDEWLGEQDGESASEALATLSF